MERSISPIVAPPALLSLGIGAIAAALLLGSAPTQCRAQDRRWALVSATTSADALPRALELAGQAGAALAATGETVIANDQAVVRVETRLSRPFEGVPEALARRLGETAERALEDVAFGRNQEALDLGQPLLADLDPHLAGLGRDERTAADVANLCLFMVRAHLQKRDAGAARQQTHLCLRLVPDLTPDPRNHPPAVVGLLDTTRGELEAGAGGVLVVHASPTDPEHCAIRVNGRALGETPTLRVPAPPGTYVVQVECRADRAGRLHSVTVAGGAPTRLALQARLAQTLVTRPALALVYSDPDAADAHVAADIAALGAILDAPRILVVVDDGPRFTLRAFAVQEGNVAELTGSAIVPEPIDDASSRAAVLEVMGGGSSGRVASTQGERSVSPIGPVMIAVGGAAVGASVITGILALDAQAQATVGCVDGHCPVALAGRAEEASTLANVTDGLLFGGLAVLGVGVVLTLVLQDDASAARAGAGCDASGCRAAVRGQF